VADEHPAAQPAGDGARRLLLAGLELFGERGFDGTTVRAIAEHAGVTPGLVVHHYGTKQGLRDAVDRYVLDSIAASWHELTDIVPSADHMSIRRSGFETLFRQRPPIVHYLRRSLLESSDASAAIFDGLMAISRELFEPLRSAGFIRPTDDPDIQLLLATLTGLMSALLPRHIERHLGVSLRSAEGVRRWSEAEYDFMTNGVLVGTGDIPSNDTRGST
jgi:TetR/AcrR family transcriptional regulator, regulator of cefoperazone and chloramphenicol sensitivity